MLNINSGVQSDKYNILKVNTANQAYLMDKTHICTCCERADTGPWLGPSSKAARCKCKILMQHFSKAVFIQ